MNHVANGFPRDLEEHFGEIETFIGDCLVTAAECGAPCIQDQFRAREREDLARLAVLSVRSDLPLITL